MKAPKTLLLISIFYYLINGLLLLQINNSDGGDGLIPYITLLVFQGVSLFVIMILALFLNKRWLNSDHGQMSKILLLSYLVVPLLTYTYIH
ncbi:MAG: hypothetical protein P1U56_16920 [Saprospiraceae bacterium]|nr:hypothetical protein [Saprospiraceae bacterium]